MTHYNVSRSLDVANGEFSANFAGSSQLAGALAPDGCDLP